MDKRIRPVQIIRLAAFPMSRENLDAVWNTFRSQADGVFTANDDLKRYLYRIIGFGHRVALADALRETLRGKSVTVIWGAEEILVKRRNRTVAICDGEPAAMIVLRGDR